MPDPEFLFGLVAGAGVGYAYAHAEPLIARLWRSFIIRLHLGSDVS